MTDYRTWKTALSVSCFQPEDFDNYQACGIEAIEISPSCKDFPTLDFPAIEKEAKRTGVHIWSLHLPFSREIDISHPSSQKRRAALNTDLFYMEKAAAVGAEVVVVHPSSEPISENERQERLSNASSSLKILADKAQELGILLAVENLPRTCLTRNSHEMLYLLTQDKRLRFCFDTNHLLEENHAEFLKPCADRLISLHISDYDFINEHHVMPGDGFIDWRQLVTLLEEADYQGPLLFEVSLAGYHKADFEAPSHSLSEIKSIHKNIKSITGKGKRL